MAEFSIRASSADPNEFVLTGQLNYDNAQQSLEAGHTLLADSAYQHQTLSFTFSEVTRVDTAGIAVLLAWARSAQANHQRLTFNDLPPQALALIDNSGLSSLLPLS